MASSTGRYRTDSTDLIEMIQDLRRRISVLERTPRIGSTSIDRGTLSILEGDIKVLDADGDLRVQMGKLPDGNYDIAVYNDDNDSVNLAKLAFGLEPDLITDRESTTSTSYTDLATTGPTITTDIGATGRALISVSALIETIAPRGSAINSAGGYMSYAVAGPTASAANEIRRAGIFFKYDKTGPVEDTAYEIQLGASRQSILTNLTPGSYTFTAKYKTDNSNTAWFSERLISVQPF